MSFAGERECHHGAAMESVFKSNHSGPARMRARDLDGVFHCFRAGIHQQCLLGKLPWGGDVQTLGHLHIAFVSGDLSRGMQEAVELPANRRNHRLSPVAYVDAANASSKI